MRRNATIILGAVVLAWAIAAVALDSPSLKIGSEAARRSASAGRSPKCLSRTLTHSAALAGTRVDVSPEPESVTANPRTQISFLGVPASRISAVSVTGSRSGRHEGSLRPYSQGDGASFVPDEPFEAGEHVSVSASIAEGGRITEASFHFEVDTPYPTKGVALFPNPPADPADYQSFVTMPGAEPPVLAVNVPDRDPGAGDIFTTNGPGPGQYGPLIYTPQGRLVWFQRLPSGETAEDLNTQEHEGQRVLTWWRGRVLELGFGEGEDLVMNSRYQLLATVRAGNGLHADLHDFQLAANDVAYITAFNPVRCDLTSLKGSPDGAIIDTAVQEIDMRTGLVRWEWHSLDHVAATESETPAPSEATAWDWFHLNSIDPEPNGDILISARNTWAAYQLQRGTGLILWRLGGTDSSFRMGPGTETAWQHDARMQPDGEVTLFDDGANPPIHGQSRGVRIALDLATHSARLAIAYKHPTPLLGASQGNMQTLPDGNVVLDYGGIPEITEYSPSGALLFDAHLPYDMSSYRGFRFPWAGLPLTAPSVASNLNNTSEETIVHASWNGATGLGGWRVLAGPRRGALTARETIPASAFEVSTILPKKYAYVAVQALAAGGRTLGSSATVGVESYSASLPKGAG